MIPLHGIDIVSNIVMLYIILYNKDSYKYKNRGEYYATIKIHRLCF